MNNHSVLFLITGLAYGGAETQLVNLAISLKKRGWEVRVVAMLPPQAFTEELKEAGIPLSTLNIYYMPYTRSLRNSMMRFFLLQVMDR